MQFVSDGPDIPDELLQAHEEGRVVFFCGAGISYSAGLPGFKGLVEKIYELTNTVPTDVEREALRREQFDAALDLLEERLPGQRLAVRRAMVQALKPKLRRKGATATQAALLRLGRSREGALRLVTTNFDRVFHIAARRTGQPFQSYAAPMLPLPKNSRWDGLVYLHGLLPERPDDTALHRLVVTSGDFGLAYLTERWAARFVGELFRNYVVCFIGYSINDPVMRYMMDALAADRRLGELTPKAWAFGECETGHDTPKGVEWRTKGVKPILYNVPVGSQDHSALHQTLEAWADTYRDGVQGKEAIVVKHALARPQNSTQQDDFVGRMLWAVLDKSGLPAKRFAEFNPVPSLDWLLGPFADERFGHGDLTRFGVPTGNDGDVKLRFSLIRRPPPCELASPMLLAGDDITSSRWDAVMFHLARWLLRHLNDPRLIIWIVQRGGQLHDQWVMLIEDKLNDCLLKEREGMVAELNTIREQAPNEIPTALMRTLWRLLLSGRAKSSSRNNTLYRWLERLKYEPLTAALRRDLREMLAPKVILRKPVRWGKEEKSLDEPTHLRQLIDWELVLAADHVRSTLHDLGGESWKSALPNFIDEFQQLLLDALETLHELGEADDRSDRSHWDLPSIEPHWQNRGFRDWVSLIELLRDAWLAVLSGDRHRAVRIAQAWFVLPYSTFKRLAFFAACQDDCIRSEQWVKWLLADRARWLWSIDTRREVLRLFVQQGQQLQANGQRRLEAAILAGPPHPKDQDDLQLDRWQHIAAHSVWLRLAKLASSGRKLGEFAAARLSQLSAANPTWQLEVNQSDEFSHWMSGTGDPDFEERRVVDIAPWRRSDLVQWLKKPPSEGRPDQDDTWRDSCRSRFFHSLYALCDLAQIDVWPAGRWREALQVWAEESMVMRSWRYAAPLVKIMPDSVIQEAVHAVTWWMEAASKSIDRQEDVMIGVCYRVLALQIEVVPRITLNGEPINQPVSEAINHPIGHATQALINLWFKRKPNDNDLLPDDIVHFFTKICDVQIYTFRHGRVILGSQLIALFRVDRLWTERNLLPLFSWSRPAEAKAVWEGFLWSPRLYQPLLTAFEPQLLETASHYTELGEHREQFAAFLTYVSLSTNNEFSAGDFRSAIGVLPIEGLERSAQALAQALEGAADQCEAYWKNRVQPFWQRIWPKSRALASPNIAQSLARLVIAARGEFPAALTTVQDWLQPIEYPHYVISLLFKSGLCSRFPEEALQLMKTIILDQQWPPQELSHCLDEIAATAPSLALDSQYRRLRLYLRTHRI